MLLTAASGTDLACVMELGRQGLYIFPGIICWGTQVADGDRLILQEFRLL